MSPASDSDADLGRADFDLRVMMMRPLLRATVWMMLPWLAGCGGYEGQSARGDEPMAELATSPEGAADGELGQSGVGEPGGELMEPAEGAAGSSNAPSPGAGGTPGGGGDGASEPPEPAEGGSGGQPPEDGRACALGAAATTTPPFLSLGMGNWGLNIPFDDDGDDGTDSLSHWIPRPELDDYRLPFYFESNGCDNGALFRAHAGGATTSGSGYPRSELREMESGGEDRASWNSSSGRHSLRIVQSINHLPVEKAHVVAGQIHDADDDITVLRLEDQTLWFTDGNTKLQPPIHRFYELGTVFEVEFVVEDDTIDLYYNGTWVNALSVEFEDAFFKAGCYTQSACSGENAVPDESCDAYGEVEIFELEVTHE